MNVPVTARGLFIKQVLCSEHSQPFGSYLCCNFKFACPYQKSDKLLSDSLRRAEWIWISPLRMFRSCITEQTRAGVLVLYCAVEWESESVWEQGSEGSISTSEGLKWRERNLHAQELHNLYSSWNITIARYEVLTAVAMKSDILWDITSCIPMVIQLVGEL
jgi:hypothetical protein